MSYKQRLSDLDRDAETSLTQQIVNAFTSAIEDGELEPGDRLPPTRAVAELAGVNHLTAARSYRRLAEMGLVTSRVGSGTYVRAGAAAPAGGSGDADGDTAWQLYALPEEIEAYGERVVGEMMAQAADPDLLPLSVGYPAASLYPTERIAELTAEVLADEGGEALQYTAIEGPLELREAIAGHMARRGATEEPDAIINTTGARQALSLVARASCGPATSSPVSRPASSA